MKWRALLTSHRAEAQTNLICAFVCQSAKLFHSRRPLSDANFQISTGAIGRPRCVSKGSAFCANKLVSCSTGVSE